MRLLRYRPRSVAETRERLRSLGFTDQEIDKTISTAEAADLLNDEAFVRLWVEDRLLHHPLSRRAIQQELAEKKIDRETINAALERLYPAEKEKELAIELAQARMAKYANLDRNRAMQRTISFLTRRGFNPRLSGQVVHVVIERLNEREIAELGD